MVSVATFLGGTRTHKPPVDCRMILRHSPVWVASESDIRLMTRRNSLDNLTLSLF